MSYGDTEPSESPRGRGPGRFALAPASQVTFDRRELNRIFGSMAARSPPANGATTPSTS